MSPTAVLFPLIFLFSPPIFCQNIYQQTNDELLNNLTQPCKEDVDFWNTSLYSWLDALGKIVYCPPTDEDCINKLNAIMENTKWSLNLLDAVGKPRAGFQLTSIGNEWEGSYESCMAVKALNQGHVLKGKYCRTPIESSLTNLNPFFQAAFMYGPDFPVLTEGGAPKQCSSSFIQQAICAPQSCTPQDVALFTAYMVHKKGGQVCTDIEPNCIEERPFTGGAIAFLFVLCLLGFLSLVATVIDYYYYRPALLLAIPDRNPKAAQKHLEGQPIWLRVLLAFSLYMNGRFILNVTPIPGQIHCLHGLRFISMSWVVLGHVYLSTYALYNNVLVYETANYFLQQMVINFTFCVDTFFVLSGLLLSFLWFKEMRRCDGKKIRSVRNWITFYVHRYIRLTPVYALVIGTVIFVAPHMVNGPVSQTADFTTPCKKWWWANIVYINNIIKLFIPDVQEPCYGVTWYLADDMQFYILSPLLLLPLWFFWKVGVAWASLLILACLTVRGFTVGYFHLDPINTLYGGFPAGGDLLTLDRTWGTYPKAFFELFMYHPPWTRYAPYVIGVLTGFLLNKYPNVKMHRILALLLWIVAIPSAIACIFGTLPYSRAQTEPLPLAERVAYATFARSVWGLCIAWLIAACHYGYGGVINRFLSWCGWLPLSRLTYCAYLLHPLVGLLIYSNGPGKLVWVNHFHKLATEFVPVMFLTYVFSFFVSAICEVSVLTLEKMILRPPAKSEPKVSPRQPQNDYGATKDFNRVHETDLQTKL